jgi:hypothetical protein
MNGKKTYESAKKLCFMEDLSRQEPGSVVYKKLVEDPEYACATCGRAAKSKENLCIPKKR